MANDSNHDALSALAGASTDNKQNAQVPAAKPATTDKIDGLEFDTPHTQAEQADALGKISGKPRITASRQAVDAKKAKQAQFQKRQAANAGMQFRKTAVPLLLVMAFLLLGVGAAMLVMTSNYKPDEFAEPNRMMENGGLFSGICLLLGLILAGGGIFFHLEVLKDKKRTAARANAPAGRR